jgi:hypothetical protein
VKLFIVCLVFICKSPWLPVFHSARGLLYEGYMAALQGYTMIIRSIEEGEKEKEARAYFLGDVQVLTKRLAFVSSNTSEYSSCSHK